MTPEIIELLKRCREWMKDREVKTLTAEGMTWCAECASSDCECAVLARDLDAALAEPPKTVTVRVEETIDIDRGWFNVRIYGPDGETFLSQDMSTEKEAKVVAASLVGAVIAWEKIC